jgi:hypothetical protein
VKSSITIAGIEVELSVSSGPLETLVAGRYVPFLGASEAPCCRIRLEPDEGLRDRERDFPAHVELTTEGAYRLTHPGFLGFFDPAGAGMVHSAPTPSAVDHALRLVYALLAPHHQAVMLHAVGVVGVDGAHVFAPPSGSGQSAVVGSAGHRPVLTDGYLILRRIESVWFAAATPFWTSYCQPGPARESKLARLWGLHPRGPGDVAGAEPALRMLIENAVLPCADSGIRRTVLELFQHLALTVRSSEMPRSPSATFWPEIEASLT